jgi:hypothetical protein
MLTDLIRLVVKEFLVIRLAYSSYCRSSPPGNWFFAAMGCDAFISSSQKAILSRKTAFSRHLKFALHLSFCGVTDPESSD